MVKSLLDRRNCWIIAAAVEQTLQSDQPDFSPNLGCLTASRLLDSKIPRGAHESGRLDREVPRARHRDIEETFILRRGEPLAALTPRLDPPGAGPCSGYRLAISR